MGKEKSSQYKSSILLAGIVAWIGIVTALYYVYHKPFSASQVPQLSKSLWQIITACVIVSTAGGLGNRLVSFGSLNAVFAAFLQAGLGLGAIGVGYFILGSIIGIQQVLSWMLLIIMFLVLLKNIRLWWKPWAQIIELWNESGSFGKLLGVTAIAALFLSLVQAGLPPVKYDALVYHLAFPKYYIEAGRITFIQNFFWGFPQFAESLYSFAYSLSGGETAAILGWFIGWISLMGLALRTREYLGVRSSWIVFAAPLSGYTFLSMISAGYVDWMCFFFGALTLLSLLAWVESRSFRWIILSGIFSGLALGTKLSSAILVFGVMIVLVYIEPKKAINLGSKYIFTAALIFLPWVIRNLFTTGNPFFPFIIPTDVVDRFRLSFYNLPPWGNWQDILLLPLHATITGREGSEGYNATLGPIFLMLIPFAFIRHGDHDDRKEWTAVKLVAGTGLLIWIIASRFSGFLIQSRLYFCIFPAFLFLAAKGFDTLSKIHLPGIRLIRIIGVIVILVVHLSLFELFTEIIKSDAAGYFLGSITKDEFLDRRLGAYYPAVQGVNNLSDDDRVLMLWEPRSLYCLPKCIPDEIIDRWKHDIGAYGNSDRVLETWRQQGFNYLLFHKAGADFIKKTDQRYSQREWSELDRLLGRLPLIKEYGEAYSLFALR